MLNVELVFSIKTGPAIESLGTEAQKRYPNSTFNIQHSTFNRVLA